MSNANIEHKDEKHFRGLCFEPDWAKGRELNLLWIVMLTEQMDGQTDYHRALQSETPIKF